MFISKLCNALNRYDQYGIIRVNTFSSLYLTIAMFLLNFIFSPPHINQLLPIFLVGIVAAGSSPSYIRRQQIVVLFTGIALIWYICINLVVHHNLATVIMNGFLLSLVYSIGKKIPIFAAIALVCYLLSIILPPIKVSGSFAVYYNLIFMFSLYLLIVLMLMNLFPRVYYYRIWARALFLCLQELALIQRSLADGKINFAYPQHLIGIYRITSGLSQKEFTTDARRINISLLRLYTYLTSVKVQLMPLDAQALLGGAAVCDEICHKIAKGKAIPADTWQILNVPNGIKYAMQQLILGWNKACLKI